LSPPRSGRGRLGASGAAFGLALIAGVALASRDAYATDVLVPEATPRDLDDFSVAYMVYDMVVQSARDAGVDLQDAEQIRAWAGKRADGCFDEPACPGNLWALTDARLTVVMSVGQSAAGLDVEVRLVGADDPTPFKVLKQTVPPGGEPAFAAQVAKAIREAVPLLPRRPAPKRPAPKVVDLDEDDDAPKRTTPKAVVDADEDAPKRTSKPTVDLDDDEDMEIHPGGSSSSRDTARSGGSSRSSGSRTGDGSSRTTSSSRPSTSTSASRSSSSSRTSSSSGSSRSTGAHTTARSAAADEAERRKMGIPRVAYERYRASGMERDRWLDAERVRTGHVTLELGAGWAMGDVDRGYGVRVGLEKQGADFEPATTSTWVGAGSGSGLHGWLGVGYSPAWWVETSLVVGVQYGRKHLDIGWECPPTECQPSSWEYTYDPVVAAQMVVRPRARFFPTATGVVKPYLLVAFDVGLYDGFAVSNPDVAYPAVDGGVSYGPTAGLGVNIAPIPALSLFVEVPGTLELSPATRVSLDSTLRQTPGELTASGYVVRAVAGLSVRM
jgi:hypothetical protein